MKAHVFRTKRVYEAPAADDGLRVLVDRLWPRGLSKTAARVDLWLKELAPSDELRRLFHAGKIDWRGFVKVYGRELSDAPMRAAARALLERPETTITLLYGSKDDEHNNAVVLAAWLGRQSRSRPHRRAKPAPRKPPSSAARRKAREANKQRRRG